MKPRIIFLILIASYLSIFVNDVYPQGIRGGDIQITAYFNGSEYFGEAMIRVYREGESVPYILFDWGDGTIDTINGFQASTIDPQVIADTYISGFHQYDSLGIYIVEVKDSFWVPGIKNIPNSENQILHLRDTFYMTHQEDFDLMAEYSTPIWNSSMVQIAQLPNGAIEHNAHVAIGNPTTSIVRSLAPIPLPGYTFPDATDSLVCCILWDKPIEPGIYAFAVRAAITRWMDGTPFGSSTRLMTMSIDSSMIVSTLTPIELPNIMMYPNPVVEVLYLSFVQLSMAKQENAKLIITDTRGQEMFSRQLALSSQLSSLEVDVRDWPAGVYLMSVQAAGKTPMVRKFVVEH